MLNIFPRTHGGLLALLGVDEHPASHAEKLVSALGAFAGILSVYLVSRYVLGDAAVLMVASMGASAVLLFAGEIRKRIVLKVSDFRSALIQGKFLAKKGLEVAEYRIESGLNCGGHAFGGKGQLMGPILEEFRREKASLAGKLREVRRQAWEALGRGDHGRVGARGRAGGHRRVEAQARAQGLGGLTTVMDVKIRDYPTHAASLPICMIPNCAATRHVHFTLDGSGVAELPVPSLDDWPEVTREAGNARRVDLDSVTREDIADWKPGDTLLLNGKMLTGRDAAHKKMIDLLAADDFEDLGNFVPGLQVQAQSLNAPSYSLRGVVSASGTRKRSRCSWILGRIVRAAYSSLALTRRTGTTTSDSTCITGQSTALATRSSGRETQGT